MMKTGAVSLKEEAKKRKRQKQKKKVGKRR